MTLSDADNNPQELELCFQGKHFKLISQTLPEELKAAEKLLNDTFLGMEKLYKSRYNCSPSALDTSTWLLIGALNLAHRVLCLEQGAALQTRNTEEQLLSKLLDSIPDDVIPKGSSTGFNRSLPME